MREIGEIREMRKTEKELTTPLNVIHWVYSNKCNSLSVPLSEVYSTK